MEEPKSPERRAYPGEDPGRRLQAGAGARPGPTGWDGRSPETVGPVIHTRHPRDLKRSLGELSKGLGAPDVEILSLVFARWEEVVGPTIAKRAKPKSIDDGTLTIMASNAAWAAELRLLSSQILSRLREILDGQPAPGEPGRAGEQDEDLSGRSPAKSSSIKAIRIRTDNRPGKPGNSLG